MHIAWYRIYLGLTWDSPKIEVKPANLTLDLGLEGSSHAWGFIRPGSVNEEDSICVKLVRGGHRGVVLGRRDRLAIFFPCASVLRSRCLFILEEQIRYSGHVLNCK